MADSEGDYTVSPGKPPLHTRFKKEQSGNPGGRSARSLPALLADALNETVVVMIDGRRRKITKREAIVTQMVDKSRAPRPDPHRDPLGARRSRCRTLGSAL